MGVIFRGRLQWVKVKGKAIQITPVLITRYPVTGLTGFSPDNNANRLDVTPRGRLQICISDMYLMGYFFIWMDTGYPDFILIKYIQIE